MLPAALAVDIVTRLRGVEVEDEYRNTSLDWTDPDEVTMAGWSVQPVAGAEYLLDRDAVTSRWQAFGPEDADVTSLDRIRFAGDVYDVDGSVQRFKDPTGLLSHTFFLLVAHDHEGT